jgi:hypothetical protein
MKAKGSQSKYVLLILTAALLSGCAATARVIDYGSMKTDVKMSESIFLTPTDAENTIFIQIRNTSVNQNITGNFQDIITGGIQGKGYHIVQKPSQATYILQVNIRYLGQWKEGMDFGGTVTGAGLGALAGLGLGGPHHRVGGAVAGGLIGAGVGLIADAATRVKSEIIVVEFQITERLSEEEDITGQKVEKNEFKVEVQEAGALGTKKDIPIFQSTGKKVTSTKAGTKIYNAAVAARAAQINLNIAEASQKLIEMAAQQINGIF